MKKFPKIILIGSSLFIFSQCIAAEGANTRELGDVIEVVRKHYKDDNRFDSLFMGGLDEHEDADPKEMIEMNLWREKVRQTVEKAPFVRLPAREVFNFLLRGVTGAGHHLEMPKLQSLNIGTSGRSEASAFGTTWFVEKLTKAKAGGQFPLLKELEIEFEIPSDGHMLLLRSRDWDGVKITVNGRVIRE